MTISIGLFGPPYPPANPTTETTAGFVFQVLGVSGGQERKYMYETQIDGQGWVVYEGDHPRTVTYEGLEVGEHTWEVRAEKDEEVGYGPPHNWTIVEQA